MTTFIEDIRGYPGYPHMDEEIYIDGRGLTTTHPGLQGVVKNIIGEGDNMLYMLVGTPSVFTYNSGTDEVVFSGHAFVTGIFIKYTSITTSATTGQYIFATGTVATPTITASDNIYNTLGALIGIVTDTDIATSLHNKRFNDGGIVKWQISERLSLLSNVMYFPNAVQLNATGTLQLLSNTTVDIDSVDITVDGTTSVTITGNTSVIGLTSTGIAVTGNTVVTGTLQSTARATVLNLTVGAIGLESAGTTNITSGASIVGIYDDFESISPTTVQSAVKGLDTIVHTLNTALGLGNLITAEVTQLQNIDANVITGEKWGYLAALNQGLTTTSDVTHKDFTATGTTSLQGNTTIGDALVDALTIWPSKIQIKEFAGLNLTYPSTTNGYSGITLTIDTSSCSIGQAVYSVNGTSVVACNGDTSGKFTGIVVVVGSTGIGRILIQGLYKFNGTSFTPGSPLVIDDTSGIVTTNVADIVYVTPIGYAITSTVGYITPSNVVIHQEV